MVLKKRRVSIPLRISIPSISLRASDVFLSYDHEDTFCSHLYHKLQSVGICKIQDGSEFARNTTPLELFDAIEESRFAIVVLSQNYASSSRRLNELSKILECMKDRSRILPIFHDVNFFHVQKQKGTFEKAFDKHEEMFQDDLAKVAYTSINVNQGNRNHPMHTTDLVDTSAEWNFLITNLGLEILSAGFDQASSSTKPQYALFGMLFSIAALFTCILELIYKGRKNGVVLKKFGKLWWYYYPHPHDSVPFGTLPDIYGLFGGVAQCKCSIAQYIYFSWHADSPTKLSLLPAIFLLCLAGSRLHSNHNHY
ncbi:hypothetical protein ACLB2K_030756 [Fragaria x ananassa]